MDKMSPFHPSKLLNSFQYNYFIFDIILTPSIIPEILSKTRTAGDGMESDENSSETSNRRVKLVENQKESMIPCRLVQIYPSNVIKMEKRNSMQAKTPKFVPYEPYPGAVKPISAQVTSKSKKSRNNMDINLLISQMSQMNTNLNEFKPRPKINTIGEKESTRVDKVCPEKEELQKKIYNLLKENESVKEQLKQQVQVTIEFFHSTIRSFYLLNKICFAWKTF